MKYLIFLLIPAIALAHPVDELCRPDQILEDGCQENSPGLCLDNPSYFAAHKAYWHCRRTLATMLVDYGQCVGAVNQQLATLGRMPDEGNQALLQYWNVIPAHPELRKQCDIDGTNGQALACSQTCDILEAIQWNCEARNAALSAEITAGLNKSPMRICCNKKQKNCKAC